MCMNVVLSVQITMGKKRFKRKFPPKWNSYRALGSYVDELVLVFRVFFCCICVVKRVEWGIKVYLLDFYVAFHAMVKANGFQMSWTMTIFLHLFFYCQSQSIYVLLQKIIAKKREENIWTYNHHHHHKHTADEEWTTKTI